MKYEMTIRVVSKTILQDDALAEWESLNQDERNERLKGLAEEVRETFEEGVLDGETKCEVNITVKGFPSDE